MSRKQPSTADLLKGIDAPAGGLKRKRGTEAPETGKVRATYYLSADVANRARNAATALRRTLANRTFDREALSYAGSRGSSSGDLVVPVGWGLGKVLHRTDGMGPKEHLQEESLTCR